MDPEAAARARLPNAAVTIALAAALGWVAGSGVGLILWLQRIPFGRLTFHSRDAIWMAPVATAAVFAGLALVPALLALIVRLRPEVTALGFGGLGAFTLLLPFGGISRWAALLVSVGVGIRLAAWVRHRPEVAVRRILRIAAALFVLVALGALALRGGQELRRRLVLAGLSQPDSAAPNVLLILLDTVRGENLSLLGYPRSTTPALERWAGDGVVFQQAFSTAPWTLPSHGSLFTGLHGEGLGGGWLAPIRFPGPTLAEALLKRGYRTAGFVANLLYTSRESKLTRGFVEYRDYPVSLGQLFLHCPLVRTGLVQSLLAAKERWEIRRALERFDLQTDRSPADDYIPASAITDGFLTWQAGVGGRPFFAFLNYFDAHAPYRSPAEFQARFASGNQERDSYDAAIAYLDAELGRLFTTLAARGVLARTLVVVTADHGELLGEHGLHGHANALYLPLLRVPLLLRYPPRVPGGVRVDQPVSLRDVPATILELVGGHPSELPGRSLAATWDSSRKGPVSAAVSEVGRARYRNDPNYLNSDTWLQSVFDEQHHYIRSGLGKEELYAWRTDSLELTNLAGSPHAAAALQRLRITLEQALGR